jgi:hypothetical protein
MLAMDTFAAPDIMFGGGPNDGKGKPKKKTKPKQQKQQKKPKNKRATPDNESYFDIDPSEKGARISAKRSPVSDELKFEALPKQAKTIRPASPAPRESDVTMSGSDEEPAAPESDDAMSGSDEDYTPLGADLDVELAKRNAYLKALAFKQKKEALARKNAAKAQANEDAPLTHDPDAATAQVDVMQLDGDALVEAFEEELFRPPAASTEVPAQMAIDAEEDEDTAQDVDIDEEGDDANRETAKFQDEIRREKEAATVGMEEDDDADAQNRQDAAAAAPAPIEVDTEGDADARKFQKEYQELKKKEARIKKETEAFINGSWRQPNFVDEAKRKLAEQATDMEGVELVNGEVKQEDIPRVVEALQQTYKEQLSSVRKSQRLLKKVRAKERTEKPKELPGWHFLDGDTRIWTDPLAISAVGAYPRAEGYVSRYGPKTVFGIDQ